MNAKQFRKYLNNQWDQFTSRMMWDAQESRRRERDRQVRADEIIAMDPEAQAQIEQGEEDFLAGRTRRYTAEEFLKRFNRWG